jgi:hypothetical protein
MSNAIMDPFEAMIRDAGESHLIDWYAPNEDALRYLRGLLAKADDRARERFGANAPRLTSEYLVDEYKHNPHKVQAFLQMLASLSPDMLVMVWRILQGMGVAAIRMEYDAEASFNLHLRLVSPGDLSSVEEYASTDIDDAVVLRHMGISKMNGRPLFDGFYALNVSGPQHQ